MSSQGEKKPLLRLKKRRIHKHRDTKVKTASIRSDINVTPLVDVVLVLLIIFMVVTPLITRGMPVEQPMTLHHGKKSDSGEQVVVSVTCDGGKMVTRESGFSRWECGGSRVFIASEMATDDTIGELVQKEIRKGTGNREIHLKADKKVNYSVVRNVMERIHDTGVSTVALGSEEIKKE